MPSLSESLPFASPLASALAAGVDAISQQQTVIFTQYRRFVLPIDGFVFWINADVTAASAAPNTTPLDAFAPDQQRAQASAATLAAKGSLHYSTDSRQNEDEAYTANTVIFTSETKVDFFNEPGDDTLWLGSFDGIRFAFGRRGKFYQQAGLYHYIGESVPPAILSQIVDDPLVFDGRSVVVSDSLPIWLSLNGYTPLYPSFGNPSVTLYPSFVSPENLAPPYVTVHVVPESGRALQPVPTLDATLGHSQLVAERVRLTLYGLRNSAALDLLDCIEQFTLDGDAMGIMNMPYVRDEKRTESDLNVLAMKKIIEFDVSYYQSRANTIARQLITSAIPAFFVGDEIAVSFAIAEGEIGITPLG